MENTSLAIVVPCYNEEEMLPSSLPVLLATLNDLVARNKISADSKLYLVDDGSTDNTWEQIERACSDHQGQVVGFKLSRNRGHQYALIAGLENCVGDIIVSIDADLQDDPSNIEKMVDEHHKGNDVVYGVRAARDADTFFKRATAEGYYSLMRRMGVDLVFNHADFRLMSRRALNAMLEYRESQLFLRGIVREVGFPSSTVEYDRQVRVAGESKYPLRKMLSLAWSGISSFSTAPLRAITVLGICASGLSMLMIVWVLGIRLIGDTAIPGWASILAPLLFIGSVQLLSLGVIGEYLAKIYNEIKQRPRYHISEKRGSIK
ncbi:glycosyltransferase family 2 protein [Gilvimarinus sp. SDUM040013]|uniref:Glycosyltransferase family 2 protein n=1 Tax=Gilvimarinus gilvus TaxID=3058038 RepID=A0ABU4RV56_9GAMM|nr:glycosyltransferase family 2 protein [Gilvimarinus sp. SDUM040013]MDO3387010.1 glycosyltransferase family 2 protein [Gilvimarinus sp. SDUM040013]MDX6848096.1 glycosyltransferase family 2 protein [Gilvimarinus sp. SDUM040013]